MKKFIKWLTSFRFIKLHIGLFYYIRNQLKEKKRTPRELVFFFKDILLAYLGELLRLFKGLFVGLDPEYQKQKKEFKRTQDLKKDLNRALNILKICDMRMKKRGDPNWKRKQFWRDFFKNAAVREELFADIEKELK